MGRKAVLKSKVPVPSPSLRLLVPPIRLMAAEMWRVVQRCRVVNYGKLEEFVRLVAEVFPDILCEKEIFLLVLGLRARVILKLCQEDHKSAPKAIKSHITKMRQSGEDLQQRQNSENPSLGNVVWNFLKLVENLLKDSKTANSFFQEVFPSLSVKFDAALQSLMGEFLSRLEKILPVPDFKEAASFLSDSPSDLEICFQTITDLEKVKTVLLHKPTTTKFDRETPFGDTILSILSYQSSVPVDQQPLSSEEVSSTISANEDENAMCHEQNGHVDEFVEECQENDVAEIEEEEESGVLEGSEETKKKSENTDATKKNKRKSAKPFKGHKAAMKSRTDCPSCSKICKSPAGLKRHLRIHSSAFSCTGCKRRFKTDAALMKHMEVHAKASLSDNSQKKSKVKEPFPCSLCGKSHTKPNPPACDQCGRRYCTYVGLYRHKKLHSGERPYLCTICGKGFTYSDILKAHMRTHTGERSHICTLCGKQFVQGSGLVRHLRIHSDERPFPCNTCSKSFRSKPELELHIRTHTGERPYQCSQCGKRFVATNHLKNHMRTHTGARPHSCLHCDKRFGSPDQLRKHILVHTGEKPHKCPECGKGFSQQGNMKIHLRTHGRPEVSK